MTQDPHEYQVAEKESAPVAQLPTTPIEMLAVAVSRGHLDFDAMKELMALEERYRDGQAKVEFDKSVAKFAGLKKAIPHNREGRTAGNATFSYADYPQTVDTITPWLKKAGLSFSHTQGDPVMEGGKVVLIMVMCILRGKSGHTESASFPAIPNEKLRDKLAPGQLLQMALTYAKRQTLSDVLGLSTGESQALDDDDSPVGISAPKATATGNLANPSMVKSMRKACDNKGLSEAQVCQQLCRANTFDEIPASMVNEVLETIKVQG